MAKPCDARPIFFMFSGDMFLALREGYQMNELCSKCGAHLSSPWRFCPLCGSVIPPQDLEQHAPSEPEKAPVQGAFSGLLFGVIVAPMCIIVGTMLCLTGLGAFLGVPMIIAGVLAPLLGPMIGIGELKGKCPWCGTEVSNVVNAPGFDCHVCSKRIAVENHRFIKAA
jgi:DNA-directed RNA polymerase subunit RPC12/RpoP